MAELSSIRDVKKAVIEHEKEAKKFSPANQIITCAESFRPEDCEYAEKGWNDALRGSLFYLHLREG